MRYSACKQKIKAVAARLSMAALALAMGLGAAGAVFHSDLLDVMRPKASASAFASKAAAGDAVPVSRDFALEPQKQMRQSLNDDSKAERSDILINPTSHPKVNESLLLPICNFPY